MMFQQIYKCQIECLVFTPNHRFIFLYFKLLFVKYVIKVSGYTNREKLYVWNSNNDKLSVLSER